MNPVSISEHFVTVLSGLALALSDGDVGQFGVLTRIDINLRADQTLEIVPATLRSDLALHLINPDAVAGTVPVTVAFDSGRLSSATFVLDALVEHLNADLPREALTFRMEVVRDGVLLDALLGDS